MDTDGSCVTLTHPPPKTPRSAQKRGDEYLHLSHLTLSCRELPCPEDGTASAFRLPGLCLRSPECYLLYSDHRENLTYTWSSLGKATGELSLVTRVQRKDQGCTKVAVSQDGDDRGESVSKAGPERNVTEGTQKECSIFLRPIHHPVDCYYLEGPYF
ncbi:hypothetical protein STEG23_035310 [Scotinomys teguina]